MLGSAYKLLSRLLKEALEKAKEKPMPDEERREQRVSWAYGNVHMHNEDVTRDLVEKVAKESLERKRIDHE